MCLIIETKKGIPISKALMEEFYRKNNDGFGFMYIKNNKLEIHKQVDKPFEDLWEQYENLKEYEPIIHLRMKTHGEIDHLNTHPYPVDNGIWLMHNGILSIGNTDDQKKSDTWHFIDKIIKPLLSITANPHKAFRSAAFKGIIEKMIGPTNRIVMGDRGGFVLFNEQSWLTINNKNTNAVGLKVSNGYAWNEDFANPKKVGFIPKITKTFLGTDGKHNLVNYVRHTAIGMIQIDNDLYADEDGEIWEKEGVSFYRIVGVSKRKKKAQKRLKRKLELEDQKMEQLLLPSPHNSTKETQAVLLKPPVVVKGTEPIIIINSDDSDESAEIVIPDNYYNPEEEYLESLRKEWALMSEANLNAMVYTDPESASKLLYRLFNRV